MNRISRRQLLKLAGRAAVAAPAISLLHISTAHAAQSVNCPIYMFHLTSGAAVESVIRANAAEGRIPVTVADLADIIRGDAPLPDAPLFCMTFDDGYLIQYTQAAPVLDRYEANATFFVMGTDWEGDRVHTYMSHAQVQDLAQRGFEIGSHTVNHASLVPLRARNRGAYLAEIFDSKTQLENLLDQEVVSFCYPNGSFDALAVQDVTKAYRSAVSTIDGGLQTPDLLYRLRRQRIN
jgi:peptidoglycan/xylan/chitin deacetylase (PgdA/CDA1 family)